MKTSLSYKLKFSSPEIFVKVVKKFQKIWNHPTRKADRHSSLAGQNGRDSVWLSWMIFVEWLYQ